MVSSGGTSWHSSNRGISLYFFIYLTLFAVVVIFAKQLHDRPKLASILPEAGMIIITGAVAGAIIKLVAGDEYDGEIDGVAESLMVIRAEPNDRTWHAFVSLLTPVFSMSLFAQSFSPTVFFVVLLPPIIFNSGYHLQGDLFFRHITPICIFACLGTVVSSVVVATLLYGLSRFVSFDPSYLELLAFGALVSATDPVSTLALFEAKKVDPQLFYLVFGESVINDAVGLVL
jgi:NhaP-type Na+/H+ or K+/H+ antiporter